MQRLANKNRLFMINKTYKYYAIFFLWTLLSLSSNAIDFVLPNASLNPDLKLLQEYLLKYYNAKQIGIEMRVNKFEYILPISEAKNLINFIKNSPLIYDSNDNDLNKLEQRLKETEQSCKNGILSTVYYMVRGNNQKSIRLSETIIKDGVKKYNENEDSVSIIDSILSIYDPKRKTLSITSLSDDPAMYFESPFIHTYLLNPFFRYITPAKIAPKHISVEKTKEGFNLIRCYDGCARALFSVNKKNVILTGVEAFFSQKPKDIILDCICRRYLSTFDNELSYPSVIASITSYNDKKYDLVTVVIVEKFNIRPISDSELELSIPDDTEIISHMGEVDLK